MMFFNNEACSFKINSGAELKQVLSNLKDAIKDMAKKVEVFAYKNGPQNASQADYIPAFDIQMEAETLNGTIEELIQRMPQDHAIGPIINILIEASPSEGQHSLLQEIYGYAHNTYYGIRHSGRPDADSSQVSTAQIDTLLKQCIDIRPLEAEHNRIMEEVRCRQTGRPETSCAQQ